MPAINASICTRYIPVYTSYMFIQRLIKSLNQHKVAYALVGGYAVALHGAIRGTVDVDLVIGLEQGQFRQLQAAMLALGLQPRLPVDADEIFAFREEYIRNRNLIAWSFYNPANPLEVVDVLITEDLQKIESVTMSVGRQKIVVASIADLIAMKTKASRPQDLEDIKALKRLL